MSNSVDLERWKRALLTGPDERFFDLIRSIFGEIQTPFNKHDLLKKLVTYLKKRETRDRILSIVSKNDSLLLTAISVLDNPTLTALYRFLKHSMRYLELHNHLLNLEERMLIYRSVEDGDERILLNPLLEDDLVLDADLVFESTETTPNEPTWLRDELLLSVIAFVREKPELFTGGGDLKSRIRRDLESRFSFRDTTEAAFRVQLLIRALLSCGVMREIDGKIEILPRRLAALSAFPRSCRAALLAGGLTAVQAVDNTCGETAAAEGAPAEARRAGTPGPRSESSRPENLHSADSSPAGIHSESLHPAVITYASAAMLLLENLLSHRSYRLVTLERILLAGGLSFEEGGLKRVLDAMVGLGLLTPKGEDYTIRLPDPKNGEPAGCVVQPNFEATLTGPVSLSEGMDFALGAELRLYDTYPVYEITREAVTRRFADGISAAGFIQALEEFSGRGLPSNVLFSLKSWEREFSSVRIFSGIVLLVDEERRHLVEHSREMSRLITSVPAPGVYLIHTADRRTLEKALRHCGIDQKPAVESPLQAEDPTGEPDGFYEGVRFLRKKMTPVQFEADKDARRPVTDVRTELYAKLDAMDLQDELREDLLRMIEKGLLLYPKQLEYRASSPRERHEAKGFDYLGKVRIIEQTLSRSDLFLEIITRSGGGKSAKHLVRPLELKKTGSDLNLVCAVLPDQDKVELRVRSMSLVRSVRGSLYPRHSSG